MDLNSAKLLTSLIASLLALSSTLYFWLVRANRERAKITIHPIGELSGTVVSYFSDRATIQRMQLKEGEQCFKYWLKLAVVNNSSLPNALLGAKVWLQLRNGDWLPLEVWHQQEEEDAFPLNLPPLTTASLKLALTAKLAVEIDENNQGRLDAAGDILPREVPIQIELLSLGGKRVVRNILDSGDGLCRTPQSSTPRRAA